MTRSYFPLGSAPRRMDSDSTSAVLFLTAFLLSFSRAQTRKVAKNIGASSLFQPGQGFPAVYEILR